MWNSKMMSFLTLCVSLLFVISTSVRAEGINITICSIDANGERGTDRTLNGALGADLRAKLLNAGHFSQTGIEPVSFSIVDGFGSTGSITVASLVANGCEVFFKGFVPDNFISQAERTAMFDWVNDNGGTLVSFAETNQSNAFAFRFGFRTSVSNATSWTATATGLTHPIFNGPFGTASVLNTANQKTYYNITTGADVLATDTSNTTLATVIDSSTGNGHAVFLGDVDVITTNISAGNGNNTDQDHATLNLFAYLALTYNQNNYTPAVPTIITPANGSNSNDNTPVVAGTADPGVTITVTGPNGESCTAVADAVTGAWSCELTPALADGSNTITAVASFAGNNSADDVISLNIDTTAPAAAVCTITPDPANDGTLLTATCTGVETGAAISIPGYVCGVESNNEVVCTATAGENGVDGDEIATVTDAAGNATESDAFFELDNAVPNAPQITSPTNGLTVSGTGEAGATVTVISASGASCEALVQSDGSWSCELSLEPVDGESVTATQTDPAGNESEPANATVNYVPDLSSFITNCVAGVQQGENMLYLVNITNTGNVDISDAQVTTLLSDRMSDPVWNCEAVGGAVCDGVSGNGDLNELVDLPVGSALVYMMESSVTGDLLDFIDVAASVVMPSEITDANTNNNITFDSDLIYQFLFKDDFECAAPGTIESSDALLNSLLN